jgi:hypothetical protein
MCSTVCSGCIIGGRWVCETDKAYVAGLSTCIELSRAVLALLCVYLPVLVVAQQGMGH